MSTPSPQSELLIKDYTDWRVGDARSDCASSGLVLEIEPPGDGREPVATDKIARNSESSRPNTPILPGGIVSVVIFPHAGPQG